MQQFFTTLFLDKYYIKTTRRMVDIYVNDCIVTMELHPCFARHIYIYIYIGISQREKTLHMKPIHSLAESLLCHE